MPEQVVAPARRTGPVLNIYPVALCIVRTLQPTIEEIARRNRNLADQLDRCSTSVVLNLREGDAHRGAMRRHKYTIALGEARETVGCLDVADAKGLAARPDGVDEQLDHVIGVLVKLTR